MIADAQLFQTLPSMHMDAKKPDQKHLFACQLRSEDTRQVCDQVIVYVEP